MAVERRAFFKGLLVTGVCSAMPFFEAWASESWYASAAANDQKQHHLRIFNGDGKGIFQTLLPARGHSVAYHRPSQQLAVFARSPGTYAFVLNLKNSSHVQPISSPDGRHFYGHGVFSKDGRWLLASENHYASGQGRIGIFDGKDGYGRVGEFSSHGIGPHELHLLADGKTLVVANGGIQTHPDFGRKKLNLDSMQSSLAYIELHSGKLLGAYGLPEKFQKMSIRHLAVTPQNEVAVAMQYQGARNHLYPLVGLHGGESSIELMPAPSPIDRQMRNYCGSIVVDGSGTVLAVSSPRGNLITFWSVLNRGYLSTVSVADGCGVAPGNEPGQFLISSGGGLLLQCDRVSSRNFCLKPLRQDSLRWDNHMVALI